MEFRHFNNNNNNNNISSNDQGRNSIVSPITSKIMLRFRGSNASGILLQINNDDNVVVGDGIDSDGTGGSRLLVELYQRTLIIVLKLKGKYIRLFSGRIILMIKKTEFHFN